MSTQSRIVPGLLLSVLVLAARAPAQTRTFTPGGVDQIPAPANAVGSVDALHALHFTTATDLDAVALVGGEVFLLHMPSRYHRFYSMGGGENAIAIVPRNGELDAVVAAGTDGLSVRTRSSGTPFFQETVLNGSADWQGVDKLWVYAEGAGYIVYGRNPVKGTILRASYSPQSGPQSSQSAWSLDPTAWIPANPEMLVRLPYSSSYAGLETAYRFLDQAFVVNQSTNPYSLLWFTAASANDRMVPLHFDGTAQESDFDDWTLVYLGGSPSAQGLYLGNGDEVLYGSTALPTDRTYTDVRTARLSTTGAASAELLLPEAADGYVTVRVPEVQPKDNETWPVEFEPWNATDTIRTYEEDYTATRTAVRCFAAGDFDLDGDTDLLVAHEGTLEMRLWLNAEIYSEIHRVLCNVEDELGTVMNGSFREVTFPLVKGSALAGHTEFAVSAWLQPSYSLGGEWIPVPLDEDLSLPNGTGDLVVSYETAAESIQPDHVLWVSIAAVERDPGTMEVVRRWPSRHLYYSPIPAVEFALKGAYYPSGEGEGSGPGGDPTGYRKGTSTGGGGTPNP